MKIAENNKENFVLGAVASSGLTARATEKAGADFLLVLNAGRLRMKGASSLACYLPIHNSNDWVLNIGEQEILHSSNIPVYAGLNVWDPVLDIDEIVSRTVSCGFAGVVNFPNVSALPSRFRNIMENAGLGFDRELELIEAANKHRLESIAYVANAIDAQRAVDAGVSMLCVVVGFTAGTPGVKTDLNIENTAHIVDKIAKSVEPGLKVLVEGGPITDPESVMRICNLSRASGYIAGSTIDRLPVEDAIEKEVQSYQVIKKLPTRPGNHNPIPALTGISKHHAETERFYLDASQSVLPVLIEGEDGVGKSSLANRIHAASEQGAKPAIVLDCLNVSELDFEQYLFGQELGFQANNAQITRGILETADNSTLLIERIDALSVQKQKRLIRFLDTGLVRRLGATKERHINCRVLATCASNSSEEGLSSDLKHRLSALHIQLTPLRERIEDVPSLAKQFSKTVAPTRDIDFKNSALAALMSYEWPGNVRELKLAVSRAIEASGKDTLSGKDFRFLQNNSNTQALHPGDNSSSDAKDMTEKDWIAEALRKHRFRKGLAAKELGISVRTLYNKIKFYGLQ